MSSDASILNKSKSVYELILFPYILLALPFGFLGALLALRGFPSIYQAFWILLAIFGARNGGMALNRLIDLKIDAQNPRTKERAMPRGDLSRIEAIALAVFFLSIFEFSAYKLNMLCFIISPSVIILLLIYSFLKRYTSFVHFFLGIIQGFVPIGAWIAVKGEFSFIALLIGIGILFWTAGFDILDKCPDVEFDKSYGLHSFPQKLGVKKALWASRIFHIIFIMIFIAVYYYYNLGLLFLAGVICSGLILAYGHKNVTPENLNKVDAVVFYVNISVSLCMLLFTVLDIVVLQ